MAKARTLPAAMPRELMLVSEARRQLQEATSVHEVKSIRDKAAAVKLYLQQAGEGLEAQNAAAEIKLRAERRAGELLAGRNPNQGGRPSKTNNGTLVVSQATLKELGVTPIQSSRWQQEASVPEEVFESHVEKVKAAGKELTSTGLMKLARRQPTILDAESEGDGNGQKFSEALRVAREVEVAEEATAIVSSLDALSGQRFGTIYADPPWQYGNQATRASTDNHYDTMTVDELCEMPIADFAADASHLHLWTTSGFLPDSFRVLEAWGFTYKSHFVWVKPQMGIGNYWRLSHEIMLLGVRGSLTFADKGLKSWGEFDRTKHSAKPEAVRGMIERASPGPYLELFGRERIMGWTVFGNQISTQRRLA